jgi:hypothetical protein
LELELIVPIVLELEPLLTVLELESLDSWGFSGGGGSSISEEQERVNANANAMPAASVILLSLLLIFNLRFVGYFVNSLIL